MPLKCSVVIPVWNPGPNLQRCLSSLLAQTLPRSEYEIICVDDGSTDGTATRLDALADAHPDLLRVLHIAHSGWPGTPRNVGIDAARAPYVHFVDNDDTLPRYALADLYAAAVASDADVVLGRPASDFRGQNHAVYRRDIIGGTLADHPELAETLTPHKMFRRDLLRRHDIRFPDGPTPLEDQFLVLRAYVHARSITLLTDRPYYHYLRRIGSGRNAGDRPVDPVARCRSVANLLDIVTAETDDDALRDRLFRRSFRVALLPALSGRMFTDADADAQRAVLDAVRQIATTRFGAAVHAGCGAAHRTLSRLVTDDDLPGIRALATEVDRITLRASARSARWDDGVLRIQLDGTLRWRGQPLRCDPADPAMAGADGGDEATGVDRPTGGGATSGAPRWALPAALAPGVGVADRLLGAGDDPVDVEVSVVSRATGLSHGITDGVRVTVDDGGTVRIGGTVPVDPARAAAGQPLDDGVWDLRLRLRFEGWHRISEVRIARADLPAPLLGDDGRTVWPYRANARGALALDVNQWIRAVGDQLAPAAMLTTAGPELELTLGAAIANGATPEVELLFEPERATDTGVLACRGRLHARAGAARAVLALPRALRGGPWRTWLRLAGPTAAAPTPLPWRVTRTADRIDLDRSDR